MPHHDNHDGGPGKRKKGVRKQCLCATNAAWLTDRANDMMIVSQGCSIDDSQPGLLQICLRNEAGLALRLTGLLVEAAAAHSKQAEKNLTCVVVVPRGLACSQWVGQDPSCACARQTPAAACICQKTAAA